VIRKIAYDALLAEFLGSMFLVMAAISPMILFYSVLEAQNGIALVANAIAVAFVLFALIEMFGSISGAHFNPVVTIVMAFEKKIGALKATLFIIFQIIGGIAGTILSQLMFFREVGVLVSVSETARNDFVFFGEIFGTFILLLAILLLAKAKSNKTAIVIGFLVGGQILATSSTMFANPQVTIARMFTNSVAGIMPLDGLIFIAMQFIGAMLAYVVYRLAFSKKAL